VPYFVLAFLSLLWGSSFLLIKIASEAFDPAGYAFGRAGVAAATLVVAALALRLPWPRAPRLWAQMAGMSLFGQVLPFLLLGVAAHLTTSADMALMMGGVPIFTFVIARAFSLGEVWNARAAAGLALGLVGVVVSLGAPFGATSSSAAAEPGLGRALALLAALGYAGGALMSRPVSRAVGPTMAATGSMLISAALLGLWLLVQGAPSNLAALTATPRAPLAALLALGVFNTALAYFIYFRLIGVAGATFAALNNYIVPLLGLALGAVALGEPVGASSWLGLAFVLAGVVLTGTAAKTARVIAERRPAP
jgi:drug/metabolite transporter (DMT)-like permease